MKARRTLHIVHHRESGTIEPNDEPSWKCDAYDMVEAIEGVPFISICLSGNVMSGCARELPIYDMILADRYLSRNYTLRDKKIEEEFCEGQAC